MYLKVIALMFKYLHVSIFKLFQKGIYNILSFIFPTERNQGLILTRSSPPRHPDNELFPLENADLLGQRLSPFCWANVVFYAAIKS